MNKQNFSSRVNDVFISYRHCNKDLVAPVEKELNRRGISFFIDREGINSGMSYSKVISKEISSCHVVLFFWTPEVKDSEDLLREIKMALDYKKNIVLYKIGDFDIKEHDSFHYYLSPYSRFDVSKQTPDSIVEVVNQVQKYLLTDPRSERKDDNENIRHEVFKGDTNSQKNLNSNDSAALQKHAEPKERLNQEVKQSPVQKNIEKTEKTALPAVKKSSNQENRDNAKKTAVSVVNKTPDQKSSELAKDATELSIGTAVGVSAATAATAAATGTLLSALSVAPLVLLGGLGYKLFKAFQGNDNNGQANKTDYEETFKLCRNAAEQGNAEAQYYLGVLYENGLGVAKNVAEAKKWYQKAAQQGHEAARKALKALK